MELARIYTRLPDGWRPALGSQWTAGGSEPASPLGPHHAARAGDVSVTLLSYLEQIRQKEDFSLSENTWVVFVEQLANTAGVTFVWTVDIHRAESGWMTLQGDWGTGPELTLALSVGTNEHCATALYFLPDRIRVTVGVRVDGAPLADSTRSLVLPIVERQPLADTRILLAEGKGSPQTARQGDPELTEEIKRAYGPYLDHACDLVGLDKLDHYGLNVLVTAMVYADQIARRGVGTAVGEATSVPTARTVANDVAAWKNYLGKTSPTAEETAAQAGIPLGIVRAYPGLMAMQLDAAIGLYSDVTERLVTPPDEQHGAPLVQLWGPQPQASDALVDLFQVMRFPKGAVTLAALVLQRLKVASEMDTQVSTWSRFVATSRLGLVLHQFWRGPMDLLTLVTADIDALIRGLPKPELDVSGYVASQYVHAATAQNLCEELSRDHQVLVPTNGGKVLFGPPEGSSQSVELLIVRILRAAPFVWPAEPGQTSPPNFSVRSWVLEMDWGTAQDAPPAPDDAPPPTAPDGGSGGPPSSQPPRRAVEAGQCIKLALHHVTWTSALASTADTPWQQGDAWVVDYIEGVIDGDTRVYGDRATGHEALQSAVRTVTARLRQCGVFNLLQATGSAESAAQDAAMFDDVAARARECAERLPPFALGLPVSLVPHDVLDGVLSLDRLIDKEVLFLATPTATDPLLNVGGDTIVFADGGPCPLPGAPASGQQGAPLQDLTDQPSKVIEVGADVMTSNRVRKYWVPEARWLTPVTLTFATGRPTGDDLDVFSGLNVTGSNATAQLMSQADKVLETGAPATFADLVDWLDEWARSVDPAFVLNLRVRGYTDLQYSSPEGHAALSQRRAAWLRVFVEKLQGIRRQSTAPPAQDISGVVVAAAHCKGCGAQYARPAPGTGSDENAACRVARVVLEPTLKADTAPTPVPPPEGP